MKFTVAGAGAWGTALAWVLHQNGHQIRMWAHEASTLTALSTTRRNARHLPDLPLPASWEFVSDLTRAAGDSDALVMAVPSRGFRATATRIAGFRGPIVSVTKGIEFETGLTMCGILESVARDSRSSALSGPSLAGEVARGIPTAIVAAAGNRDLAREVQQWFHRPELRVYTTTDLLGVELGGALKNVMAIAAGVADGLGFGDNAKAALVTRSLSEMRRLGVAAGAQAETFSGLSGLGDLTVTCFSKLSRNRSFGERVGRGESIPTLVAPPAGLVEGYPTTRSAHQLARRLGVDSPVTDAVYAMLYAGMNPAQAVRDLLARGTKSED